MTASGKSEPKLIFRLQFEPEGRIGRGKIQLLTHIKETGSISAGGRAMDMSYRRAWLLVDEMNRLFKEPVVESQRGGKQGGGAVLTPFGEALMAHYQTMEDKARKALADDIGWIVAHLAD
jgi:molybdate transport system regulatory protein